LAVINFEALKFMKIDFRTIEIEKIVFSYLGILLLCLGLKYLIDFDPYYIIFILPITVPLYIIFSGKVIINISNSSLSLNWIKKPYLTSTQPEIIDFAEIIRWKYKIGYRGPDQLTIILRSGKKISFKPSIFNRKDLENILLKKIGEKIEQYNSKTPKDILVQKIENSGYMKTLNDKINKINIGMLLNGILGFITLLLGVINDSYTHTDLIWIFFLCFFCSFFVLVLRYRYLKVKKVKHCDSNN